MRYECHNDNHAFVSSRWYVDNGREKGFVERRLLVAYTPSGTNDAFVISPQSENPPQRPTMLPNSITASQSMSLIQLEETSTKRKSAIDDLLDLNFVDVGQSTFYGGQPMEPVHIPAPVHTAAPVQLRPPVAQSPVTSGPNYSLNLDMEASRSSVDWSLTPLPRPSSLNGRTFLEQLGKPVRKAPPPPTHNRVERRHVEEAQQHVPPGPVDAPVEEPPRRPCVALYDFSPTGDELDSQLRLAVNERIEIVDK